ncbi:hypothetical protein BamIOP4010DRAFT_3357 [Burkholderia ambifaria IOP40-10]|uniref:Uncharacterized protein n=1 Tax=Burkholderia ambifaria IOP40-10 TaxID=396596 RepID=B1FH47_9BURK|nr:hypothetical protein BamIOP4010DRAFT_3357 [Burkholderia ambifaria IOP40-10]
MQEWGRHLAGTRPDRLNRRDWLRSMHLFVRAIKLGDFPRSLARNASAADDQQNHRRVRKGTWHSPVRAIDDEPRTDRVRASLLRMLQARARRIRQCRGRRARARRDFRRPARCFAGALGPTGGAAREKTSGAASSRCHRIPSTSSGTAHVRRTPMTDDRLFAAQPRASPVRSAARPRR